MQDPTRYEQLPPEDRMTIASMTQQGCSMRAMARMLHRAPSTISREVARNAVADAAYGSHAAQLSCQARRLVARPAAKMDIESLAWMIVQSLLRSKWSPQQIAGTEASARVTAGFRWAPLAAAVTNTATNIAIPVASAAVSFLYSRGVRIFDYARFAEPLRDLVRSRALEVCKTANIEVEHVIRVARQDPQPQGSYLAPSLQTFSGLKSQGNTLNCCSIKVFRVMPVIKKGLTADIFYGRARYGNSPGKPKAPQVEFS